MEKNIFSKNTYSIVRYSSLVLFVLLEIFNKHFCEIQVEVWLTIYAQIDTKDFWQFKPIVKTERRLILNWINAFENSSHDWIGLYSNDTNGTEIPIYKFYVNNQTLGQKRTEEQIQNFDFNKQSIFNGCLKSNGKIWHIVYVRNGTIIAKNCFKTNPFWMESSLELIGNKKLNEIAIPGTHDSGCYHRYALNNFPSKSVYMYAQDERVFDQLVYGIRYIDMRISYNKDQFEPLQVSHGPLLCYHSVRTVLTQIENFLSIANKEIVIFDIHELRDFMDKNVSVSQQRHQQLIDLIKQIVGKYLTPESYMNKTINQIIESNKRLVIGYTNKQDINNRTDRGMFWPHVKHLWPKQSSVKGIEDYFESKLCSHSRAYLRSAMAQMTPTIREILFNFRKDRGLRERADYVNPLFTKWFYQKWWNCINIVSADYFLGSNVVEIAIKVNKRRFSTNSTNV